MFLTSYIYAWGTLKINEANVYIVYSFLSTLNLYIFCKTQKHVFFFEPGLMLTGDGIENGKKKKKQTTTATTAIGLRACLPGGGGPQTDPR